MEEYQIEKQILKDDQIEFNTVQVHETSEQQRNDLRKRYQDCFKPVALDYFSNKFKHFDFSSIFQAEDIQFYPLTQHQSHLSFQLQAESINSQVMVFKARWGRFALTIGILNTLKESYLHSQKCVSGSYGHIYLIQLAGQQFVMKCLPFKTAAAVNDIKQMAIKEYFLLRIASALNVGPKMKKWLGFDLIMHKNCIEFAMEYCQAITVLDPLKQIQLLESLWLLHEFKIFHFDIKPENILQQPSTGRAVMIDFGLSQILQIEMGQTIPLYFRGTLDYCCPDFVEAFLSSEKKKIDPYYNDCYSMLTSFKYLYLRGRIAVAENQEDVFSALYKCEAYANWNWITDVQYLEVYRIKWYLYQQDLSALINLMEVSKTMMLSSAVIQLLSFLYELQPSSDIKYFYQHYLSSHLKEGIEFIEIRDIYSCRFSEIKTIKVKTEKKMANMQIYEDIPNYISKELAYHSQSKFITFLTQTNPNELRSRPKWIYFKALIGCISFSNNIYKLNLQRKEVIIQNFVKVMWPSNQYFIPPMKGMHLIKQTIRYIYITEIRVFYNSTESEKKEVMPLIFDLIEQFFILHIDTFDEFINSTNHLYSNLRNPSDKILFLLKIKHNIHWMRRRLKCDQWKPIYALAQTFYQWCFDKMSALANDLKEQNSEMSRLSRYLYTCWQSQKKAENMNHQIYDTFKSLSPQLYFELVQHCTMMMIISPEINKIQKQISKMYSIIPSNSKQKIYPFLLSVYEHCLYSDVDLDKVEEIYSLIESNLNCEELNLSYIFYYSLNYQPQRLIKNPTTFCEILLQFLYSSDLNFMITHHEIIIDAIIAYGNLRKSVKIQPDINNSIQEALISRTCQICYYFNNLHLVQQGQNHECLSYDQIDNFFKILISTEQLTKRGLNTLSELEYLKTTFSSHPCKLCRFIIMNFVQIQKQNYYKETLHQKPNEIVNFFESSKKIEQDLKKNEFPKYTQFFKRLNHFTLYELCSSNLRHEAQYHGILRLYQYLKHRQQIYFYTNPIDYSCKLLFKTLEALLFQTSFQEVVSFMISITDSINKRQLFSSFHIVYNAYDHFLKIYWPKLNFNSLYKLVRFSEQRLRSHSIEPIFNFIYYYFMLFYLKQDLIKKNQVHFVKRLSALPMELLLKFQCQYYRFALGYSACNTPKDPINDFPQRKVSFIIKKTVKIFKHFSFKVLKVQKLKKTEHTIEHFLRNKCQVLGGPYDLEMIGNNRVQVKMKKRKN